MSTKVLIMKTIDKLNAAYFIIHFFNLNLPNQCFIFHQCCVYDTLILTNYSRYFILHNLIFYLLSHWSHCLYWILSKDVLWRLIFEKITNKPFHAFFYKSNFVQTYTPSFIILAFVIFVFCCGKIIFTFEKEGKSKKVSSS